MVVNRVGSTCRHDGELRGRVALEEAESCEGGGRWSRGRRRRRSSSRGSKGAIDLLDCAKVRDAMLLSSSLGGLSPYARRIW